MFYTDLSIYTDEINTKYIIQHNFYIILESVMVEHQKPKPHINNKNSGVFHPHS